MISMLYLGNLIVSLYERINSQNYLKFLDDQILSTVMNLISYGYTIFQNDTAPINTGKVTN